MGFRDRNHPKTMGWESVSVTKVEKKTHVREEVLWKTLSKTMIIWTIPIFVGFWLIESGFLRKVLGPSWTRWSKHTPWVYVLYGQGKSRNQGYPNAPTIGGWYSEDAGLRPPRLAGKIWEDLSIWEIRPVILLVVNRTTPASTPQQSQLEVQKWSSLHFPRVSLLFYKQRLAALQVEVSDLNVNLELGPITFSGWVTGGSWSMTSPRKWRLKRMWLLLFNG